MFRLLMTKFGQTRVRSVWIVVDSFWPPVADEYQLHNLGA